MQIIFSVVGIIVAFILGTFITVDKAVAPTPDQVTTESGTVATISESPAALTDATTTATQTTNLTPLFAGSMQPLPTGVINTYTSPFNFSFTYDSRFQTENTSIVLPGGNRISALALVRYVAEQHCGLSGLAEHCRPYLENPAIAFGVIDQSPKEVVAEHLDVFAQYLESVTLNGISAAQYYAGVEGEGVVTMLVPLKNKAQTLVIQYTYDTLFDTDTNPATLSAAQQKTLVDTILTTVVTK
jgi:hypothetical protein